MHECGRICGRVRPPRNSQSFRLDRPSFDDFSNCVDVARVLKANSCALDKKFRTLVEKSAALSERSRTRCAGISGGSGQLTAEGGVFVAQPPSESIKVSDTPIRFTVRGIALLPGRHKRLSGDCFFPTKFLLQKLSANGVVLSQLRNVSTVESGRDLVAPKKARGGAEHQGAHLHPNRKTHAPPLIFLIDRAIIQVTDNTPLFQGAQT